MGPKELSKKQVKMLLVDSGKLNKFPEKRKDRGIIEVTEFSIQEILSLVWTKDILPKLTQAWAKDILPKLTEGAEQYADQKNCKNCTDFFRWCNQRHIYYREDTGWLKADDPHYGPFTDQQQFEFYQRFINQNSAHDNV